MEIQRVKVPLDQAEIEALVNMADEECRHPDEQLRFLLRSEARRRGLLDCRTPESELSEEEIGGTGYDDAKGR